MPAAVYINCTVFNVVNIKKNVNILHKEQFISDKSSRSVEAYKNKRDKISHKISYIAAQTWLTNHFYSFLSTLKLT